MMNRRQFLLLGLAVSGAGALKATPFPTKDYIPAPPRPVRERGTGGEGTLLPQVYSASTTLDGQNYINRIDLNNKEITSHSLPFRAHDVQPLARQEVLAFGRRPSSLSARINLENGQTQLIKAATGRHFYGHGCLSNDRSILFTTENDFGAARGVIGIRDAKTLEQIGEYASYGVGPHDIQLMPDGKTLLIANGGIQTHPDFGRRKLNLETMQASLVYIDIESGKKRDEYRLDNHLLSIRHLVVSESGDVGVATQYQGDIYQGQPKALVAWQANGGTLKPMTASTAVIETCHGYMADLAYDPVQNLLAVTTPRGNNITFWDTTSGAYLYSQQLPAVSGIQFLQQGIFLVSTARGDIYQIKATRAQASLISLYSSDGIQWDNHLILG